MEKLDHLKSFTDRLLEQYKNRPIFQGFVQAIATEIQEIENVFHDLKEKRSLNAITTGRQLDRLGSILDLKREGDGDDIYLTKLFAKVSEVNSKGTFADMLSTLRLLVPATCKINTLIQPGFISIFLNESALAAIFGFRASEFAKTPLSASIVTATEHSAPANCGIAVISQSDAPFGLKSLYDPSNANNYYGLTSLNTTDNSKGKLGILLKGIKNEKTG